MSAPSLKILIATTEAIPFAKTGGLADVTGVLARELGRLGHDVRLVLPGYRTIEREPYGFRPWRELAVPVGGRSVRAIIERAVLPLGYGEAGSEGAVPVYAVRYPPYFDRDGLYQEGGQDYPDNLERFAFFCRAILELLRLQAQGRWDAGIQDPSAAERAEARWVPDVLHVHDWQTALCPVYLRTLYGGVPELAGIRTLLTVHNLGYQGLFPRADYPKTGLPPALFTPAALEYYGSVNLLKGGLVYADFLSTVSQTYSQEIQTAEFGFGLQGVIAEQRERLRGIVNGIDPEVWNPATDRYLPAHYSAADLSGKQTCKAALQRELGLPVKPVPVLGVVSRLAEQKGADLIAQIIPDLLELDVQLAVLGMGDRAYETQLRAWQAREPQKVGLRIGFDEALAHRIEAGADMFLMPSRYEPCGLNQQYSLRYGTIPIVSSTGGLVDTVVPYSPRTVRAGRATGFAFGPASAPGLLLAVLLALRVYQERPVWEGMIRAAMATEVSWSNSTRAYVELYREIVSMPRKQVPRFPGLGAGRQG